MLGDKIKLCEKSGHNIYHGPKQRVCRTCDRKRTIKRYTTSTEYRRWLRKWQKNKYYQRKKIIDDAKDKPCMDCGIKYNSWVMQLDHVRGTKKFTIGQIGRTQSEKRILEEISKCEVVCSNCHCERTHKKLPEILARKKSWTKYPIP